MFKYMQEIALLVIVGSTPYLVSWLRLRSRRSMVAMYDSAKYIIGVPNILG